MTMKRTTKDTALKLPYDHVDQFIIRHCRTLNLRETHLVRDALNKFVQTHVARYHSQVSVSRALLEDLSLENRERMEGDIEQQMVHEVAKAIPEVGVIYSEDERDSPIPKEIGRIDTCVTYFLSFKPMFQGEDIYVGPI